tara:strand:+ start:129 stop:443 length:315 start_codon:yes stop_codon:yes gene_type:complete
MEINLKTTGQHEIFREVLAKAIDLKYDLEHAQVGYNENSGYIWMWSEWETYTIGIADYAYHRGEDVQIIITCPETGEEFFGDSWDEANAEYKQWCKEEGIEVQL